MKKQRKKVKRLVAFFMLIITFAMLANYSRIYGVEKQKIAYITFDDGPSKYTSQIVDILDENDVKGTFFMLNDNMIVFNNVVKRLVDEGHGAGFHGVTHDIHKLYKTQDSAINEFKTCNKTFYKITGKTSKLIRIPFGSKPNMIESMYDKFVDEGYLLWDWTIDTEDWKSSSDQILSNVLYYARNKDEIVILLHENQRTVSCLNDIIKVLKCRGYDIRPITQDIKPKNFW